MNVVVFGIAAWIALGLDLGFRDVFQLGELDVSPSFVVVLLAYVCLWARPGVGIASALVLGIAMDLVQMVTLVDGGEVVVLGPHALGAMLGGFTVITLRSLMFRKNMLSLGFLAFVAAALVELVAVSLLEVRSFYDGLALDPAMTRLGSGFGSAMYTGALALVGALVLGPIRPLFSFQDSRHGAFRIQ